MRRLLVAAATLALAPACSLMGLTSGLEPALCEGQGPSFCEDLNESHPTGDPCRLWACDESSGRCAVLATDLDGDGVPAEGCGPAGAAGDCDDEDPTRFPGNAETCDLVDNDCDGVVDQGAFEVEARTLVEVDLASAPSQLSHGLTAGGRPGLLYGAGVSPARPAAALLDASLSADGVVDGRIAVSAGAGGLEVSTHALALAGLGEDFAVALATRDHGDGCERIVVGELADSGGALSLPFDETHFEGGLPDEAGLRCAEGYAVATLAMASSASDLLLAYAKAEPASRTLCRDGGGPDPAPVLLSHARRTGSGELATDEVPAAVVLGESADPGPPAILGLAEGPTWLVALAEAGGGISLHRVTRTAGAPPRELNVEDLLDLDAPEPFGEVALAAGPTAEDGALTLGLAFRAGCAGEARVFAALLAYDGEAGTMTLAAGPTAVASTEERGDERRPALAYWPTRDEWLVAYQKGTAELRAARLDHEGRPIADDLGPLLEVPEPATGTRPAFALPAAVVPLESGHGLGVLAVVPRAEGPTVSAALVDCPR